MNTLPVFSRSLGLTFIVFPLFGLLWTNVSGDWQIVAICALITVGLIIIANWQGNSILFKIRFAVQNIISLWEPRRWLIFSLGLGILLRLAVAICFPAVLVSDHVFYLDLAHRLSAGLDYAAPQGRAYWPPGVPLIMAGLLPIFGAWSITIYNLGIFIIADLVTFALGRMLGGWKVGCVAALTVAMWPNFILATPLLVKECLLIALWPSVVYFYLKAQDTTSRGHQIIYSALAGAAIGYSALTHSSGLLLPLTLLLFAWLTRRQTRRAAVCVLVVMGSFLAVITPWTIRNYAVLHHFVPVATVGGENLYMVSRPESNGRWGPLTQEDENALGQDEITRNKNGFSLGIANYLAHPVDSIKKILPKPLYQYGHDVAAAYRVFERGQAGGPIIYSIAHWMSNGFYIVVVLLILLFVARKEYQYEITNAFLLLWIFMYYPIFAHSLFEAKEPNRYGTLAFMAIFAAMALCGPENIGTIRKASLSNRRAANAPGASRPSGTPGTRAPSA
jgi:hypothetical protein